MKIHKYNIVVLNYATNSVCFHNYYSYTDLVNEDIENYLVHDLEYNIDEISYMFNDDGVISVYNTVDNDITDTCI